MQSISGEVLAQRVAIGGTYLVRGGSFSILTGVAVLVPGQPWTLDLGVSDTASIVGLADVSGGIIIDNVEAGDVVHVHMAQGAVTINASCTGGNIVITGSAKLVDTSAGTTVDTSAMAPELMFTYVLEDGETFEQSQRLQRAAAAGRIEQLANGDYLIKSKDLGKDRIDGSLGSNNSRDIDATDSS
jgi:hypothetical protein